MSIEELNERIEELRKDVESNYITALYLSTVEGTLDSKASDAISTSLEAYTDAKEALVQVTTIRNAFNELYRMVRIFEGTHPLTKKDILDYTYHKQAVDEKIAEAVADAEGLKYVDELPSEGKAGLIYLRRIKDVAEKPVGAEIYIWEDGNFMLIARTDVIEPEDGVGIASIEKTGTEGLVDTYTITLTDGTTTEYTVTNGTVGADGVGIVGVEQTGSEDLVDTYTITMSNGTETTFTVTNGTVGADGAPGEGFSIYKTYESVELMEADTDNVAEGKFVLIATSVEVEDNARLYVKGETEFIYLTDLSGSQGIQGEKGDTGEQGIQGEPGTNATLFAFEIENGELCVVYDDGDNEEPNIYIENNELIWEIE